MNVLRLLIAGVLCASAGVSAAADLRLGYVSTERVYREVKEAVTAQKRLESEFSAREKDLAAIAKRARDIQTQLETGKLSDGERKQKERDLLAIDRDFQPRQRDFRQELSQRRLEEFAVIQDHANKVIRDIAKSERFDLILQDVVYVDPRFDITERVLKALDE